MRAVDGPMCLNLYWRSSSSFPSRFPKLSRYPLMEPYSFSRPKIVFAFSTVARIFFSFRTIPELPIKAETSRSDRRATLFGEKSANAFRKLGHFFSTMLQFKPAVKMALDMWSKYPWSSLGGTAFDEGGMRITSLSALFIVNFRGGAYRVSSRERVCLHGKWTGWDLNPRPLPCQDS